MKVHKIEIGILLAALILVSCTACNNNKAVPAAMATVSSSSISSAIGVSSLVDSATSSAVSSTASASTSSTVSKTPNGSLSTAKPSGGTTVKPSGGSTGGSTGTGGPTTKPSGGGDSPVIPPAPTSVNAQYHGATYGCKDQSQYSYVMGKANAITSSSRYQQSYNFNVSNQDAFAADTGIPYSDALNKAVSIADAITGSGSASSGSAYAYFTGANKSCADQANALEAALHVNGINARLCWGTENGTKHMWVQANVNGSWYYLEGNPSTSLPAGYNMWGSGYNYG